MIKFDDAAIAQMPEQRLRAMARAGETITETQRLLAKTNANVVGQCLANQGTFYEYDHYPSGDVYDDEYHAQYYYHSHRPEGGEHGHFHTFLRAAGMPPGIEPVPYTGKAERPEGDEALTHFVAISMDKPGQPMAMFTTNRWVTDETFYKADDVEKMLDCFVIDHTWPCLATNQWITAMMVLFRPQIIALLKARDKAMKNWAALHPGVDIYEDRDLEITSFLAINVDKQIALVNEALAGLRKTA
ncbi:MAG TPA: hypothetical protein ENJ99_00710 [Rhizobiales bacterium]|nr:hypothetical protein [Hyphomicrobiales bacterium]